MDIKTANEDIRFIKEVINQTQHDITKTGFFFFWVGVINLLSIIIKELGYLLIDFTQQINGAWWFLIRSIDIFAVVAITFLFFFYYSAMRKNGNDLSKSILKIWGALLIGGRMILKFYFLQVSEQYSNVSASAVHGLEKTAFFLLILVGFLFMGVLVHDNRMIFSVIICVVAYFVLLSANVEVSVGSVHGNRVIVFAHDILLSALLSVGMILSGVYLSRRRINNGGTK